VKYRQAKRGRDEKMANLERDLKQALINKEEIEDQLGKLDEMLPKKYLDNEVHNLLKSDYAAIKEQSDHMLANLEKLNSEKQITEDQYRLLKSEYHLINEDFEKPN